MSTDPNARLYRALGVISGTSMDGVDVAIVETDGAERVSPGPGRTYPYPAELREQLQAVIADHATAESAPLADVEQAVTRSHGDAIERFMREHAIEPRSLDVIGLHGQTVYHRPERRFTRQLGSGAAIARRFGVTTVSRFRHADVAAGGQGAPLVPLYHQALAQALPQPIAVLNIGGVANLTYIDAGVVIAFDTGPGNALIDDLVRRRCGAPFDVGGRIAAAGTPDQALVEEFARHPYFGRPAPKSLDRNDFHALSGAVERLRPEDAAATFAEFTVRGVAAALQQLPRQPIQWLVAGGGRHNTHLMRRLAAALQAPVAAVETVGWDGDLLEAQCFGYLAVRTLRGLPLTLPSTTGAPRPLSGGEISAPA